MHIHGLAVTLLASVFKACLEVSSMFDQPTAAACADAVAAHHASLLHAGCFLPSKLPASVFSQATVQTYLYNRFAVMPRRALHIT